jgi:phage terminase large subunit-like protein
VVARDDEQCRLTAAPELARIVVAVDPPASGGKGAAPMPAGWSRPGARKAALYAESGIIYVIADESAGGLSPALWAAKAIALWRRLTADALVVEVNQGGDIAVIGEQDRNVPVIAVHAKRGKWLRAEPVAALDEQGKVKHAGSFPALEDEICEFNRADNFAEKPKGCAFQSDFGKP